MKFSTKIVALQHREWSKYYLDYNGLKRILAEIDDDEDSSSNFYDASESSPSTVVTRNKGEISLLAKPHLKNEPATSAEFLAELYSQVQKITLFVIKEQGLIADELLASEIEHNNLKVNADSSDAVVDPQPFRHLRERYNRLGANLLHLIQFIDLNVKGIVRILKKHDKRVTKQSRAYDLFLVGTTNRSAVMMASLRQEASLDALCVKLQTAYTELRILQEQDLSESQPAPSASLKQDLERGRRRLPTASRVNKRGRSPKGLGRRHRSVQGLQELANIDEMEDANIDDNYNSIRDFKPLVEDRRLSVFGDHHELFHHSPSSTGQVQLNQDDFIMAQIYAARRNLKQNDEIMNMLATTALGFVTEPPEIIMPGQDDRIKAEYERAAALDAYKRSSAISGMLNFVSSFIYMANYLIVVPTVVTYSEKLGANPALSSAIVGMTPFATIFSTIVYSWWTSYSYRIPLLFAASLNVIGNLVYALGYPCKSMTFVLVGRLLSGLGSCRPINRRYIADAYSTADRTAASAHFVAVGSFGMALGPFLGSVLHRIAEHSKNPYWQVENAPGWFMAGVWFVYVIFHIMFFVDPPKEEEVPAKVALSKTNTGEGEKKHLLGHPQKSLSFDSMEQRIPIWKNAAVMVNFFIYFVEKLLMECVSSSTSILTDYYFNWPGSWAGYYLSFLCLLVLPVNLLVAYLSKTYEDRQMMVVMQIVTIFGCFIILRYGESYYIEQYLIGSLMIVVFSNMVEGPNMSLLSKTIPKAWRKGFLNVGLLATEAATMGRTAGDAYLAVCGAGGLENQLNFTFGSMVILTMITLWISYHYYDALIPTEDKTL